MPRKKEDRAVGPPEETAELVRRLTDAVEEVAGELKVLRTALDEIRDDLGWAISNDRFRPETQPVPLTSMPRNPLAPDWSERLNRFGPGDLPDDETPDQHCQQKNPSKQAGLW
jgi:hypothetical protein